jgi:hypothetical protein
MRAILLLLTVLLVMPFPPPTLTATWAGQHLVLTVVSDAHVVFVCPAGADGRCASGGARFDGGSGTVRIIAWAVDPRGYVAEAWDGDRLLAVSPVVRAPTRVWMPLIVAPRQRAAASGHDRVSGTRVIAATRAAHACTRSRSISRV